MEPGAALEVGMVPYVGDGRVGLTTEQVGGKILFQQDCSPKDTCAHPPCLALSLGPSVEPSWRLSDT